MKKWEAVIKTLGRYSGRHPQVAYVGLSMFLQLGWKYIKRAVPGVVTFMGLVEAAIQENLLPEIMGMEKVPGRLMKLPDLSDKSAGLVISNPTTTTNEFQK